MTAKPWWQSKTLWVNAIALIGSVVIGNGLIDDTRWTALSMTIQSLLNIFLRLDTDTAVGK
jgi:hypothetical protein